MFEASLHLESGNIEGERARVHRLVNIDGYSLEDIIDLLGDCMDLAQMLQRWPA